MVHAADDDRDESGCVDGHAGPGKFGEHDPDTDGYRTRRSLPEVDVSDGCPVSLGVRVAYLVQWRKKELVGRDGLPDGDTRHGDSGSAVHHAVPETLVC